MRRRAASEREAPFALWRKVKGGERLFAVNAAAGAHKLRPGMAVADARALCPALRLEDHDPHADAATLAAIADWCGRFTPLAALDSPDGVMLDVSGAAQLFGGESSLLDDVARRLNAQGFAARTALAPGPALARALARCGGTRLVPPDLAPQEIEAIAARLPLAALELPELAQKRLARAGLRSVGDLLARPRAPLAARLGQEALARLDALLCRSRDPIAPRFPAPAFVAERRFPEGLTQLADIEATLRRLAEDLQALLERRGVGARRLEASFYRVDGVVRRLCVGTSRPLRDPARIFLLLRERLDRLAEQGLDTGYGFDVLRLCAVVVERLDEEQAEFAEENPYLPTRGEGGGRDADDIADLVDRLGARLGARRVLRLHPQERHSPEAAVAAAPAAHAAPTTAAAGTTEKFAPLARPLRLFERPEPIDAMALAPDGPPLRFRWRRALHETAAFEGPERIAPPWWQAPQNFLARDYYNVVDKEGRRFWLYREGAPGQDAVFARWFLHGLF